MYKKLANFQFSLRLKKKELNMKFHLPSLDEEGVTAIGICVNVTLLDT